MSELPPNQLGTRTADLDWAHRQAGSEESDLGWVDVDLMPDRQAFRQRLCEDGEVRFQQRDYMGMLPTALAEAAVEAQGRGVATAWEALVLLFAQPEWLTNARAHLWSPWSPRPALLASLVEAFGVEQELHQGDADRLGRLAALLPGWHPYRGTVARAAEILEAADCGEQVADVVTMVAGEDTLGDDEATAPSATADEVFVCRGADWWDDRADDEGEPLLRIRDGVLRFQPAVGQAVRVRREDILVRLKDGQPIPRGLLRLLPVWTVVRPVVQAEKS